MDVNLSDLVKDNKEEKDNVNDEIKNIDDICSNVENMEIYAPNHPFRLSLRIKKFEDDKQYKSFIKKCEQLIRSSTEYKLWRNYIVDVLQHQNCDITNEVMGEVHVEIHHHVPSLFTTVMALINKHIEEENNFCTFDICQECIELHFKNKIGYCCLIKSMHEKFHNGFLKIPINLIKGDYQYFIDNYIKYLDDESADVIRERVTTNINNSKWNINEYPGLDVSNG